MVGYGLVEGCMREGFVGTIFQNDIATIWTRCEVRINKSNLKYYLAILRLMCVNAILTFRAPYEKTLELAHFHTNYGKTNSLKERTSEEMSDNKVLSPDRSET
jgi:hypothetical protein